LDFSLFSLLLLIISITANHQKVGICRENSECREKFGKRWICFYSSTSQTHGLCDRIDRRFKPQTYRPVVHKRTAKSIFQKKANKKVNKCKKALKKGVNDLNNAQKKIDELEKQKKALLAQKKNKNLKKQLKIITKEIKKQNNIIFHKIKKFKRLNKKLKKAKRYSRRLKHSKRSNKKFRLIMKIKRNPKVKKARKQIKKAKKQFKKAKKTIKKRFEKTKIFGRTKT